MSDPVLRVRDLTVHVGDHCALEKIDFRIGAGDFLAVVGPNGSGKTTLIRTVLGLLEPSEGSVSLFGDPPGGADPHRVGYVPQIKTLERHFPARSIELVMTGVHAGWPRSLEEEDRAAARRALERVGAAELSERSLGTLSGGELQRVYLARSLVRTPSLVLLDEPGTGIDVSGSEDLYELLDRYQREKEATIVMVTHDLSVAYHHASHALVLDRRQISFGSPREALSERALRTAFGHVGHRHVVLRPEQSSR